MLSVRSKATGGGADKFRTHMMFSSPPEKEHKRARRTTILPGEKFLKASQQLHSMLQEKEVAVQTVSQLDPKQWTGNQRVIHFGPMAQRDPFYYYYPKGWDVLYPAHFGFFPYRTKKSRGSSPLVCLISFGTFFTLAGLLIAYLVHSGKTTARMWVPLNVAGPIFVVSGTVLLCFGLLWWIFTLQLCNEHLRHTQAHHFQRTAIFVNETPAEKKPKEQVYLVENSPFTPPPPIPVLENVHTDPSMYKPVSEMKLFPPIIPGASSTLAVARSNLSFSSKAASLKDRPYNYFSGTFASSNYGGSRRVVRGDSVGTHDYEAWPEYHASKMHYSSSGRSPRRAR